MFDVNSESGLAAFNKFLADNAFASGFTLSGEDACLFAGIGKAPDPKKYANIARWYRNIASYTDDERKTWPVAGASVEKHEKKEEADEDIDLFGSDDEEDDEEKARITAERLKAYEAKKAKKPAGVAKSNIIFDVKPWDDTINIAEIEKNVRGIETDGLVWGTAKVLPIAYGINKLQICCVVEDDKVSSDWLEEQITAMEDLVQSVDVVAFNKV
ncbi:putative elongation factor 1-beta/1-delta 1 [Toxocara canis]|uniref:Putative elongation factor 1-beta/1-delta 1 n=1 Tax=Toxocara canis TaxID=6265 RepID=A0A0B2ULJ9_TOXCA|nr:putative elongation factor 1-beta/1-delta 1 [Toxocara canis]